MAKRFSFALSLAAGVLLLSSCGEGGSSSSFATVSYYDNAPTPSLVGIDYVIKGHSPTFSPLAETTYDFRDRSGGQPATGTYFVFSDWDYGNYPAETSISSGEGQADLSGTPVDPEHVYADCAARATFLEEYYEFTFVYKDGGKYLRRGQDSGAYRELIGSDPITFKTLKAIEAGTETLDYPGRETTDDLPEASAPTGHASTFLGYGSERDSRTLKGYVEVSEIAGRVAEGEGDPEYAQGDESGYIYVDTSARTAEGDPSYPLWIYLDNGDDLADDWINIGNLSDEGQLVLNAVYSEPVLETYDVTIVTSFESSAEKVVLHDAVSYGGSLSIEFLPASAKAGEEVSYLVYKKEGENSTLIHEGSFAAPSGLSEGQHYEFSYSSEFDLNSVRSDVSVEIDAEAANDMLEVTVVNEFAGEPTALYPVEYGTAFEVADPVAAGKAFYGYAVSGETGYSLYGGDLGRVTESLTLYACFAEDTVSLGGNEYTYVASAKSYEVTGTGSGEDGSSLSPAVDSNLTGIDIPVTALGSCFGTDVAGSITDFAVPDFITGFAPSTFSGLENLVSVSFGTGITEIPAGAFQNSQSLTGISFPAVPGGHLAIGDYAFRNCRKLAEIENLEGYASLELGIRAFHNCQSLSSVCLPGGDSVAYIGSLCFGSTALTAIRFDLSLPSEETLAAYGEGWNLNDATGVEIPYVIA